MVATMTRRIWPDDIRERLKIEAPLPAEKQRYDTNLAKTRLPHFHVWVERGYSGALSPALADPDAVNAELRDLLEELGNPPIAGNSYFPFTGLFIKDRPEPPPGEVSNFLNVSVHTCRTLSIPCNKTQDWR